ncbi:unnamed protein product, partial [marine sediment metagenome]
RIIVDILTAIITSVMEKDEVYTVEQEDLSEIIIEEVGADDTREYSEAVGD